MKCPKCGNEVSQEEAFCGQCGAPKTPPANATEMVGTPPPSGRLGSQYPAGPFTSAQPPHTFHPGTQAPSRTNIPPSSSFISQQNAAPNQQTGFYHDATEAMTAFPGTPDQTYNTAYPQQSGFPGASMPGNYPGSSQFNPQTQQAFQTGNYPGQQIPPSQSFPTGQNYDYGTFGGGMPQPPARSSGGSIVVIVCVCLVVALVVGIGAASFFMTRNQAPASTQPTATTTAAPSPTASVEATPSPTEAATPTQAPSPTPSPTLAVTPTAVPDANFTWCTDACHAYGFQVEYPNGWAMGQAVNAAGVQFVNPAQGDQYASFKAPGPTTSSANDLVAGDLQTNFASKPGYTAPTATSATTISGETWVTAIAYYLSDAQQKERVEVIATVHQGKAYVIELQAPDSQFDAVNGQFFNPMLSRYQFL
ncbi:hypothetical protein KSF_009140 [Reticulibacter mediterranei]|uniref:Zinc-ribbon domain-containing protein n=1 Tax=Reticulibacter mediterranei TaxID=2778369 RepID=A0A8J3IAG5_9CHLR|nr:zinc ribbon domain-containing protein [Reticulibacter mediterranei]GHO90866.1 hypothetical protein KSF_009140 [Reticulibacter mediterranei]